MLLVIIVAIVCAAVVSWVWIRRGSLRTTDAERFAAARAMTNRWAEDPMSAPKPVLDIARQRTDPAAATPTSEVASDA